MAACHFHWPADYPQPPLTASVAAPWASPVPHVCLCLYQCERLSVVVSGHVLRAAKSSQAHTALLQERIEPASWPRADFGRAGLDGRSCRGLRCTSCRLSWQLCCSQPCRANAAPATDAGWSRLVSLIMHQEHRVQGRRRTAADAGSRTRGTAVWVLLLVCWRCAAATAAARGSALPLACATISAILANARPPAGSRLSEDVFRCPPAAMLSPERRSIGQVRRQRWHTPPAPLGLLALPTWDPDLRTRQSYVRRPHQEYLPLARWLHRMIWTQTFCSCASGQRQLLQQQQQLH